MMTIQDLKDNYQAEIDFLTGEKQDYISTFNCEHEKLDKQFIQNINKEINLYQKFLKDLNKLI